MIRAAAQRGREVRSGALLCAARGRQRAPAARALGSEARAPPPGAAAGGGSAEAAAAVGQQQQQQQQQQQLLQPQQQQQRAAAGPAQPQQPVPTHTSLFLLANPELLLDPKKASSWKVVAVVWVLLGGYLGYTLNEDRKQNELRAQFVGPLRPGEVVVADGK
jgi:hypothetical protein